MPRPHRSRARSAARSQPKKTRPSKSAPRQLSARKKLLFAVVTCLVFFSIVEGVLFLAGVRPYIANRDPFVGFVSQVPLFVVDSTARGEQKMITAENKLPWFNRQSFARSKPKETYRIFCLGGSTTYGRPYDDATSFCGWLREFLPAADSSRQWEVINAGGISYASYRVAQLLEELVNYEPDLFVIYTGHNEFLEDRTYGSLKTTPRPLAIVNRWLAHTRTYSAMASLLQRDEGQTPVSADNLLPSEVQTKLDQGVGPDAFTRDDPLQQQILAHFELNLRRSVDMARAAGAEVMLIAPASNLRDCSPFKSEAQKGLGAADKQQLYDALQTAKDRLLQGDVKQALESVDQVLHIDDRYAEAHYLKGQCLARLEKWSEARVAFERARDEDVCPLRALSDVPRLVRKVAEEKSVPVVDFQALVDDQAEHGIPGKDLFLDHVHPTVEAHRLLALRIVDELDSKSIVRPIENWGSQAIDQITARVEAGLDGQAQGRALRNLAKVLSWAGKRDEANQLALRAAEILETDVNAAYLAGSALIEQGQLDEAIEKLRQVVASDPHHIAAHTSLGAAYHQQGMAAEAESAYLRALDLDADYTPALHNLATIYLHTGRLEQAEPLLQKVVALRPRFAKGHHSLGSLYVQQRNWPRAIASLQQAIAVDHEFAAPHADLGSIYESQNKESDAVYHYRQALRINDRLLMTANALSSLLATSTDAALRDGEESLRWALHAARGTSYKNPGVFNTLAAAYAATGDFQSAVSWQQKALEAAPPQLQAMCRQRIEIFQSGRALHEVKDRLH